MDLREVQMLQFLGGMFGGGIDVAAIVLFVTVGVVYFLAPVLGYRPDRRGSLAASLYVLVGYGGLSVIQVFMQYMQILDRTGRPGQETTAHLMFLFAILKMALFVVAMVMFAAGLQSLRFRPRELPEDED